MFRIRRSAHFPIHDPTTSLRASTTYTMSSFSPLDWTAQAKGKNCRPISFKTWPPATSSPPTGSEIITPFEGFDPNILPPAAFQQLQLAGIQSKDIKYVWLLHPKSLDKIYGKVEPGWCCAMSTIALPFSILCGCCICLDRGEVKKWMNTAPFAVVAVGVTGEMVLFRGATEPCGAVHDKVWLRGYVANHCSVAPNHDVRSLSAFPLSGRDLSGLKAEPPSHTKDRWGGWAPGNNIPARVLLDGNDLTNVLLCENPNTAIQKLREFAGVEGGSAPGQMVMGSAEYGRSLGGEDGAGGEYGASGTNAFAAEFRFVD